MNLHDVIRRPVVTEKSNIAREERNVVTLAVDPRANKHEIRQRRRDALRREGARGAHDAHAAQVEAGRPVPGPQAGVEEGDRAPGGGPDDRVLRGSVGASHGDQELRSHVSRTARHERLGLRGAHAQEARALAARGPDQQERRPQRARPRHHLAPGRRAQAPLPADRLPARQDRDPGARRGDRVRPEPLGQHRAAPLQGRREALHPRAQRAAGRRRRDVRARRGDPARATRCRSRRSRSARWSTPSR